MGNPTRKHSNHRTGKRNANKGLHAPGMGVCSQCGHGKPPHVICPNCGTYKRRQVVEVS